MTDQIIETTVDQFVNDKKGFTSVDICNAIKITGTWVANREVAKWLRNWAPPSNYGITKITVQVVDTGNTAQAGVYLPDNLSVSDYTATAQEAMTPDAFQTLHGVDPFAVPDAPAAVPSATPAPVDHVATDSKTPSAGDKLRTMFKWPKTAS
ncbi:MAG: hypothetical protein DRQ39_04275 [Gammaproteobacteria bacterium]|nr:MAG: hypothetical protein DRQ39_04275 [Gammaproteobacteria bacterium]